MRKMLALTLSLLGAGVATGQDPARIVTDQARPERCLAAVVIREIDGAEVSVSHRAFDLEPGPHTMNGMAHVDTTFCPVTDGGPGPGIRDLAAEFEAGKTYFVGLDHASKDRGEWQLVIWRIERDGVPLFPDIGEAGSGDQH